MIMWILLAIKRARSLFLWIFFKMQSLFAEFPRSTCQSRNSCIRPRSNSESCFEPGERMGWLALDLIAWYFHCKQSVAFLGPELCHETHVSVIIINSKRKLLISTTLLTYLLCSLLFYCHFVRCGWTCKTKSLKPLAKLFVSFLSSSITWFGYATPLSGSYPVCIALCRVQE